MRAKVTLDTARGAETVYVVRDRMRFRGRFGETGISMLEVQVPPGACVPVHTHASPEVFRMLSGRVTFTVVEDGRERRLLAEPGDVINVPAGALHGYANTGTTPAEFLVLVDESMERFFREAGTMLPGFGPPAEAELAALGTACAAHGITFAGTAERAAA